MTKETLKNNNIIEITSDKSTISVDTLNPGLSTGNFDKEKSIFKLSFRAKINKPIKVGTISVSAAENNKFIKSPQFKQNLKNKRYNNGNLVPILKEKKRDDAGNIISYLYNLMYTIKKQGASTQRYTIHAKTKTISTVDTGLTRVICSDYKICQTGEARNITIHGSPGTNFVLSVNKITDITDDSLGKTPNELGVLKSFITNSTEESITNTKGSNKTPSVSVFGDSTEEKVLYGEIGSTGKYTYRHVFPSATSETRYTINIKNQNISTRFDSQRWTLRTDRWAGWYSKELTQLVSPTLTLRLTTTQLAGFVSVDSNGDGVLETFNNTTPIDLTYSGVYGVKPRTIYVKYVMKATKAGVTTFALRTGVGAAVSFTNAFGETQTTSNVRGLPSFSSTNQSTILDDSGNIIENGTSWTNTLPTKNGGMSVDITNINGVISTTTNSNDTLTLTFNLQVNNWGREDVTMVLAQDQILSQS